MAISQQRSRITFLAGVTAALWGALSGCNRAPLGEKAERARLRQVLRERAYDRAVPLAERIVQRHPAENGAWDRLVQAQFGKRDFAGATTTLEQWRRSVGNPSVKLDEYAGDLAVAGHKPTDAVQRWHAALHANEKNVRVLEKIARLEHSQQHWLEENDGWTALLSAQESAEARVQRALCRRRLDRWDEAWEDLHKAQEAAPDDPEVLRATKLFDQLSKQLAKIRDLDARLAAAPNDAATITDRSLLFLRAGDAELALADGEAAAKLATWAVRPRLFCGIALAALGRPAECEKLGVRRLWSVDALTAEFLETISRLDAEISVERANAELYAQRAWQLNDIGQPRLALDDAEYAQRLNPKSAAACAESSYASMKLGHAPEAYEQIKRATELDANLAIAWQYRGEIEMERSDFAQAIDSLSRGLRINQSAVALLKREQCYRRLGLVAKADEDHRLRELLTAKALQ